MADSKNPHSPHNASVVSVIGPVVVEWACSSTGGNKNSIFWARGKHLGT
jgi:hypothetical protein